MGPSFQTDPLHNILYLSSEGCFGIHLKRKKSKQTQAGKNGEVDPDPRASIDRQLHLIDVFHSSPHSCQPTSNLTSVQPATTPQSLPSESSSQIGRSDVAWVVVAVVLLVAVVVACALALVALRWPGAIPNTFSTTKEWIGRRFRGERHNTSRSTAPLRPMYLGYGPIVAYNVDPRFTPPYRVDCP